MKLQFPNIDGLGDTVLGPCLQFSQTKNKFVQVLHTGTTHWLTISNIGCCDGEVDIYDSFNHGQVNTHVKKQIANIMSGTKRLPITIQSVQQQDNGLWAFFYSLCSILTYRR